MKIMFLVSAIAIDMFILRKIFMYHLEIAKGTGRDIGRQDTVNIGNASLASVYYSSYKYLA